MTDPLLGKLIAQRHLLVHRLAEGPLGVVYRAECGSPPERLALKLVEARWLKDPRTGDEVEEALARTCGIESVHVAKVREVGREADGALFLAMEYLEGETLAARLEREGPLPLAQALALLRQLGDALSEAHALGLVHGHLQPRKVFLTRRDGEDVVKLLGLGLAPLAAVSQPPSDGRGLPALLDPHYLCPEQARGAPVDSRSDIYSLATLTYAMLCGLPPFAGSSPFLLLTQHLEARAPALDERRPDLPVALTVAVAQGLSKAPEARFPTVVRFLQALQSSADAATVPPTAGQPPLRPTRSQAVALAAPLGGPDDTLQEVAAAPAEAAFAGDRTLIGLGITSAQMEAHLRQHTEHAEHSERAQQAPAAQTVAPPGATASRAAIIVQGADVPALTPEVFAARTMLPDGTSADAAAAEEAADSEADTALGSGDTTGVSLTDAAREWFAEGMAAEEALQRSHGEPAALPSFYGALGTDALPQRTLSPALVLGAVLGLAALVLGAVFWLARDSGRSPLAELQKKRVTPRQEALPAPGAALGRGAVAEVPAEATPAAAPGDVSSGVGSPSRAANTTNEGHAAAPNTQSEPVAQTNKATTVARPTPAPGPAVAVAPTPTPVPEPATRSRARRPVVTAAAAPTRAARSDRPTREANQRSAELQVDLGQQRLRRGGYNEARSYFSAAVQLDSRNAQAHGGLGEVAFELGNYVTAAQRLRRAAQLSPGQPRYVVMLGDAYFKQGRTNDALAQYRRALTLAPGNAAARSGLEAALRRLAREGS
ncbi:MAG: tetratricopeptide repeat protein [Proteobacteria bacterium]|nr:tetratricopeptide repeat protein [Pseudomonadota bacterium]